MRRFLLSLGYCGTNLRGVQKQLDEGVATETRSIAGLLEKALIHLRPAIPPVLTFSSRTDAGVHAICNTAHVDLKHKPFRQPYEPEYLTIGINRYFQKAKLDIRVHNTVHVPPTFHSRYDAVGRTYLYRLAVITPETDLSHSTKANLDAIAPIGELHRSYIVSSPFDIEKVKEAGQLLQGNHDFAAFTGKCHANTIRSLDKITIKKGQPLLDPEYEPLYNNLQFWDITINSRAFLYRQVRRTVGVLVALAQDRISFDDLQQMLRIPSRQSWPSRAITAPPGGLYLVKVHYSPESFIFPHPNLDLVEQCEEYCDDQKI